MARMGKSSERHSYHAQRRQCGSLTRTKTREVRPAGVTRGTPRGVCDQLRMEDTWHYSRNHLRLIPEASNDVY